MALNNKLIVLDIDKRFNRLLLGKSLDTTGARSYRMRLIYNNSAFDLTGLTVQVGGTKPDGFGVLSSCKVIDVLKGIIEVDFTTQMLTTPGILKLEIIFLKGDIRLSSIPFEVEVIQSATNYNQMISSNDFLVFQDELKKMRAQMDAAVDKINARYNITEDKANKLIDAMQHTVDGTIANEVYNNTYETIEGTNIKCAPTFAGYSKDLVIEGRTLQNLFKGKYKEYIATESQGISLDKSLFKPSTTYTVIFFIKDDAAIKIIDANQYLRVSSSSTRGGFVGDVTTSYKRNFFTFTTDELINGLTLIQRMAIGKKQYLKDIIILEGDWTDKEIPSYFEDIKSVGDLNNNKVNIISNGKNLFDGALEKGTINMSTGENDNYTCIRTKNYIKINPNTKYSLSRLTRKGQWGTRFYDIDKKYIGNMYIPDALNCSFTTPDNAYYIRFVDLTNDLNNKYQLVIGDTNTEYEPYVSDKKEILLPISDGLKSLPNKVSDRIYEKDGEVILEQNVGKVILNGSEEWSIAGTQLTNTITVFLDYPKGKNGCYLLSDKFILGNYDEYLIKDKETIFSLGYAPYTRIAIRLPKSKLQTPDVNGFKKWLQTNLITVYYQLSEPIYHKIEDYKRLKLRLYNGESYVNSNNIVKPIIKFGYPGTLRSSVDNTFESITDMIPEDIGALSPENLGKWRFSDRDLLVNDKRALVGYNDADGNKLIINYNKDFKNGVYIYGPIFLDGLSLGATSATEFKNCIPIIDNGQVMEIGRYIDFHYDDSEIDNHVRLECTGKDNLYVTGNLSANGNILASWNDNKAILGIGPSDIFVCNNKSQKYLQLKNDGGLCYSNRNIQLEPQAAPLWRGYHHMTEDEIIPPTKRLSQCTNGWVLVWSDFNAGGTGEDFNFCLTYIPKNTPWKNGQGYNFCTPVDMGDDSFTAKYIYVFDDHIAGHKDNKTGKRADVVIRAVLEY